MSGLAGSAEREPRVAGGPRLSRRAGRSCRSDLSPGKDLHPNVDIPSEDFACGPSSFPAKAVSGHLPNRYGAWFTETQKIRLFMNIA
ncbi:hypothetical protein [Cohnella thermotolerans]|uniref:hypothetical protein n=1 Tax=Cohnella thermotolerans TaxID=329858 RepID=UPI000402C880|nr:hypothetical protein [Cohnella thermotolerans]